MYADIPISRCDDDKAVSYTHLDVYKRQCHPCGIHECPRQGKDNMACMKNIPVDVVMKYAEELLAAHAGAPAYEWPPHPGDYKCRVIEL